MAESFIADIVEWNALARVIGDANAIHKPVDRGFVGIPGRVERPIALGAYLVSRALATLPAQGELSEIEVRFSEPVYDGQHVDLSSAQHSGYFAVQATIADSGKTAFNFPRLVLGDVYTATPEIVGDAEFAHVVDVSRREVEAYARTSGMPLGEHVLSRTGMAFLYALAGPALLAYAGQCGAFSSGVHVAQTLRGHHALKEGELEVEVRKGRERGPMKQFGLTWKQEGIVLASGNSTVLAA